MTTLTRLWKAAWTLWLLMTTEDFEIRKNGHIMKKYEEKLIKEITYALWVMYPRVADKETQINMTILKHYIEKQAWKFTKVKQ